MVKIDLLFKRRGKNVNFFLQLITQILIREAYQEGLHLRWEKILQILQNLTVVTWVTFPWCWRPLFARHCSPSCSKLLSQSLWLLDLSLPSEGFPPEHTYRCNWFINNTCTCRWFSTGFTKRFDILTSHMYRKLSLPVCVIWHLNHFRFKQVRPSYIGCVSQQSLCNSLNIYWLE